MVEKMVDNLAKSNAMSSLAMAVLSPEKAGVGGSTPSLATIFPITSLGKKAEMHRTSCPLYSLLVMLVIALGTCVVLGQAPVKPASGESTKTEDFATAMKKI